MTDVDDEAPRAGYDEIAEAYDRHWGPVIRPAAERVLDVAAPWIDRAITASRGPRLLDVGTGTGALAIAALERWPALEVTGVDPSRGMLDLADAAAEARLPRGHLDRFVTTVGWADELPFDDGAFDLAVSSFVLQLVASRAAALREIRRVLRPGAPLAWVAWRRSDRPYEPDRVANEILDDFGFDPPEPGSRNGDLASPASAAAGMRRAGFRAVRAWAGEVEHAWDARGYLDFLTLFDEATLFAELDAGERGEIEAAILERVGRLSADERTLRLPVVYVVGRAAG